nr:MAG TPA: Putative ryanodine receptor-2, Protein Structure Initiative, Structural [Microviridae sp.]
MSSEIWQALIDGKKAQDMLKNSREKLAAFMHDTWSDWFVYQFNNSTVENIQRWQIQSNLPYSSLMEEDKDKDRKFADKIISIITKQGNE